MLASLLTQTKIEGGSIVREVTEDAVIAYDLPDESFVEITLTDAAKNLIAIKNCSLDIDVIIYTL
jgi:hypothetical protein